MSYNRLQEILASIQMDTYFPLFLSNHIGDEDLGSLTIGDLKEIGISSVGHRKKIIEQISALNGSGTAQEVIEKEKKIERVYFEGVLTDTIEGIVQNVKITSRRAVLGSRTYSLQNINTVSVYSNEKEVEALNNASKGAATAVRVLLFVFGVLCVLAFLAAISNKKPEYSVSSCCGTLGFLSVLAAFLIKPSNSKREPHWSVRISAGGAENDVLKSYDKSKVEEIVNALNTAIVDLNM